MTLDTHSNVAGPEQMASETDCESDFPGTDTASVFVFPATPAQHRFWVLDQLQPGGNPALNMCIALRWLGPLDHLVLRRALNALVARHEALRTTFDGERGPLRQLIAPTLVLDLPTLDASDFSGISSVDLATHLIREEVRRPLDLRSGPLVRGWLLQLAPQQHLLVLTLHHIVSDGWSNGILTRDLCALYTALLNNTLAPLPELTIQFADYADWQQTQLTNDNFASQRNYWRAQLAGELHGLDLPLDRPRRSASNILGDIRSLILPLELVRAAKALGAAESASPFMVFFTIFQVLLYRYTNKTDFLVITPSANRERREFESLVGLFVNPLLLRADLGGDPTFTELVGRVRRIALEAFSNQDIPFESLLDEFQGARLQVNFQYDSGLPELENLPEGVTVEAVPPMSTGTVYELSAALSEDPNGLRLEFEYNTALFDAATIDRMLGHYQTLLQSAVADPAKPISILPLLTEKDLGFPVSQGVKSAPKHLNVRQLLAGRVATSSDAAVARQGRRGLSGTELLAQVESARKADQSDRAPSDLDLAAACVAHWRAGTDTDLPGVVTRSPEVEAAIAGASLVLHEYAGLVEGERMASFSPPGAVEAEEIGVALLAKVPLIYPPPDLLSQSPAALATWLETENISVAWLPATAWNRVAAAIDSRKLRKPTRLRLVIATEGDPNEGSFGQISPLAEESSVRTCRRTVLEEAGGTIALDGKLLPLTAQYLRLLNPSSRQPLPVGVTGELFVAHGAEGLIPTGQLARWLPDGSIDRLGRADEQRYSRGFRLDPRRVEMALCKLPGVRHALVQPATPEPGSHFVAYLMSDPVGGLLPSDNVLRQFLQEQSLPHEVLPASFIPIKEIPLTSTGHLDRAALPTLPQSEVAGTIEPVRPYLGLQLQLIAIWEDVLGVRGIGIRDDFFNLGGNSLLAMRMLHRAELACGKVIIPSALFRNPNIEHLAGEIAREVIDESPTLLRVNDTGSSTPFFYLHGDLSGGGFYSLKLSRALGSDQPFYVLPPQDIRLLPAAPSIEEMAATHLAALRAVRPNGPYVVGGFCIGGVVAYELAQQIEASGESVEMLLMIDSALEDNVLRALRWLAEALGGLLRWDDQTKVEHFGRWALWRGRLTRWSGLNVRAQVRVVFHRLSNRFMRAYYLLRPRRATQSVNETEASTAGRRERDVPSAFLWAAARYRPKPYCGPVAVLLSDDVMRGGRNIAGEWQQLVPTVAVYPLTGSHLECITAHVNTLAQTIESCLESADAKSLKPDQLTKSHQPQERAAK